MDTRQKETVKRKLALCMELAREFPTGPTAQMIRELEAELREQLRALEDNE
jgi:hypothetical protein